MTIGAAIPANRRSAGWVSHAYSYGVVTLVS